MLNIGKLKAGQESYYLDLATGVEDYYTGRGEAPGRWMGVGAAILDLDGLVDVDDLTAVLEGRDPHSDRRLNRAKLPGFDLTFRAPKSVSLLYGLGEAGSVTGEVVDAHDAAVDAAIAYLESTVCWSRRRVDGKVTRFQGDGFIAAGFRHQTSRAGDPTLHTHVLVANATRFDGGRWGALDARGIYTHARTAGFLYQAHLRAELTRRLGVEWGPVVNGCADIAGIPRELIEVFSQRRAEILEVLDDLGYHSARAADIAAVDTRKAKTYDVNAAGLRADWAQRADAEGFGPDAVAELLAGHAPRQPVPVVLDALIEHLTSPEGLTEHASTFCRRDVLRAIAEALPEGADVASIEALADQVLADERVIGLPAGTLTAQDVIRDRDGRLVAADPEDARYSTIELLATETHLVDVAEGATGDRAGLVGERQVDDALARHVLLSREQKAMVRHVCRSGAGVDPVVGAAGSGKTTALAVAHDAWVRSGYQVHGAALSARAAAELRDGSGIDSATIATLLGQLDTGRLQLGRQSIVVVDEAAMVGTRTLARLTAHTQGSGAKLVLVGDHHQLPEIDAGGAFRALTHRLPTPTLVDNRRQHEAWERRALDHLRVGQVADAVAAYDTHQRIITNLDPDALRERLVGDWWADHQQGFDGLMVAAHRDDVADLNRRAHTLREQAGELGPGPRLRVGERIFAPGDRVMATGANHYDLDVLNGDTGTITHIDPDTLAVTFHADRPDAERTMSAELLAAGHLELGYARTNHKTQGATVDRVYVLADDGDLDRQAAYTALSRGRHDNRLYVLEPEPDTPDVDGDQLSLFDPNPAQPGREHIRDHVERELSRDRSQRLATDHLDDQEPEPTAEPEAPVVDIEPEEELTEIERRRAQLGARLDALQHRKPPPDRGLGLGL